MVAETSAPPDRFPRYHDAMSLFANPKGGAASSARRYVDAILELLGDRDPLDQMSTTAERLRAVTSGLSDETLRLPEREGKWSVIEVTRHIAETELVYSFRFRIAVAQENAAITGFDQDLWAQRLRYRDAELAGTLELFRVVRTTNLELLRSLTPAELQRSAIHEERGPESVELMMKLAAGHDLIHLRQIERIRAAINA